MKEDFLKDRASLFSLRTDLPLNKIKINWRVNYYGDVVQTGDFDP